MTVPIYTSMSSNNQTSLPSPEYSYGIARSQQQDLTPYSAVRSEDHSLSLRDFFSAESDQTIQVSSFNLPARADTNLYTPISMTSSPQLPVKTTTPMDNNSSTQIKLSPSMSPVLYMFDEDEYGPRFNATASSVKAKGVYPSLCGSLSPGSPTYCGSPPVPYFGHYGVSAPTKMAHTPPSTHPSPRTQPARIPNSLSLQSYHQSPNHTASTPQAPVLIAPSPHGLRPAMSSYRHNSLPSSRSPPAHSRSYSHSPGSRRAAAQKKAEPSYNEYLLITSTKELRAEINDQEMYILEMRYTEGMQWKELSKVYSQKYSKKTGVSSLQMRKTRLMQRLSERACEIAACSPDILKWEGVCAQLSKYRAKRPRSPRDRHSESRKWEVHSPYNSQYDIHLMRRARTSSDLTVESFDAESWRDSREETGHSLHDPEATLLSALSNASMEDHLDRAALNAAASARFQQRRQEAEQHQNQQSFSYPQDQHQQQHHWGQNP